MAVGGGAIFLACVEFKQKNHKNFEFENFSRCEKIENSKFGLKNHFSLDVQKMS